MKDKIMLTTLLSGVGALGMQYYFAKAENGKVLYCEALTPTEASCKYMIANNMLDGIVLLGREDQVGSEDESGLMSLREGRSLFGSDLNSLSDYGLLRYRLAEYMEDKEVDGFADSLLSDEEKEKVKSFVGSFLEANTDDGPDKRLNRGFHLLMQNEGLQEDFDDGLRKLSGLGEHGNPGEPGGHGALSGLGGSADKADQNRFRAWALHYLYGEMKDSLKMDPLDDNKDVKVLLGVLQDDDSVRLPRNIMNSLDNYEDSEAYEGTDIYMCIQNTEASMVLDVFNLIDLIRIFPESKVKVCKTISATCRPNDLCNELQDMSDIQSVSGMLSGIETFLKYGKTKGIVEYWKQSNIDDPTTERIIYAMRNIDNGISLCDIGDIERGINSLRDIMKSGADLESSSPSDESTEILLDGIRRDYGRLLETDEIEFIDLVKWAYRKEFWQQTLTLIESRAPQNFVDKGFYYYCSREEDKDGVLTIFARIYNELKPYEKYKMDDISHYYVKYFTRMKANRSKRGNEYLQDYAKVRVAEMNASGANQIRACSACSDPSALADLLFAYYYVGRVRNSTNHAEDTSEAFTDIMKDSDSSERMETIRQCVDYFLHCYDKVSGLTDPNAKNVIKISTEEVVSRANSLYKEEKKDFKKWNKH